MPYVYILKSVNNDRYYIGSTTDLKVRLRHHKAGLTHSTKRLGEVELVFKQSYPTIQEARVIEFKLKKLKRKDYIKKIVSDGHINMRV